MVIAIILCMLTMSEKFKQSANLVVANSITLQDEVTDAELGKGRKFVSRFIEAGLVHYKEFGDVLITKETLDKFINTMIGCPVIINHKDITDKNVEDERVGVISNVWYNDKDGWYYCEGIIWDKDAIELVKNKGWNVSCSYDFKSDFESKTHNGKKIDMEFTDGNFLHLALVEVPRYERANIVINSADNWVEPENIDHWFSTKTGTKVPVTKGQTDKEAFKRFIEQATKTKQKMREQRDDAFKLLALATGKDADYLKKNIKKENVNKEIRDLLETSDKINIYGNEYKSDYYGSNLADLDTTEQAKLIDKAYDDIMSNRFENIETKERKEREQASKERYKLVKDFAEDRLSLDDLEDTLARYYEVAPTDITADDYNRFFEDVAKYLDKKENKVNNGKEIVMTALNELENFVRGIVENACKKEEVKNEKVDKRDIIRQIMAIAGKHEDNEDVRTIAKLAEKLAYEKSEDGTADNECKVENEDKRKLIDEIGGILKGKVDDEIIRTIMKKAEELAYEKSEVGTADNKCKNADEKEKEEKFEEEEEIADVENEEEIEEEEINEEKLEKDKKVENSSDLEEVEEDSIDKARNIAYNGNIEVRSSYITRAERLELGNNY